MHEYDRIASPLMTHSADRGIAVVRWGAFWSAIVLPFLHVPLLAVAGLTPSSTPLLLSLWLANAAGFVLGRHHSPRTTDESGADRR